MFDLQIYEIVNILAFILGVLFGGFAQKNQFCFSGAIKDYILTSSTKRFAGVLLAMIVAIISSYVVSNIYGIDLTQSIYYKNNINYFAIIIGSILFGIGMVMADGCSSRHLVKLAQGDLKSLIVLTFIAIFAYATTRGFLYDAVSILTLNETLINISSNVQNFTLNIYIFIPILTLILLFLLKKLSRLIYLYDAFVIGLLVSLTWYISSVIGQESMQREITLQGLTFVYPTAKTLDLFTSYQVIDLSFGVSIVLGVLTGAFLMSKVNKKYSFGCTSRLKTNSQSSNIIGGSLMGTGGVIAIGCTVGQGLTGLSTLAFSSFLAIVFILSSGYITAIILNKTGKLPMCFIFEWNDDKK